MVLSESAKRVGQICATATRTLATTKDLVGIRTYQTSVRLHLYLTSTWRADDILDRNITSSDVEYLEGRDLEKKSSGKTTRKIKDKPESTRVSIDNARHMLTASDLSGFQADCDIDMNEIALVIDQMIDKGTYFIAHSPVDPTNNPQLDSTAVKRKNVGHQSRYVES